MRTAIGGVVLGFAILTPAAFGQEAIQAEKQAPIQQFLPNSYGSVEALHVLERHMAEDTVTNDEPYLEVTPTIGSTFFNEKLDTNFNWVFRKKAGTSVIEKTYLYNVTTIDALSGDYGFIKPYAETYQGGQEFGFSESYVGVYLKGKNSYSTPWGSINLEAYSLPVSRFTSGETSKNNKVEVRNDTGRPDDKFTLDDTGETKQTEIEERHNQIWSWTGFEIGYVPAGVPNLTVAFGPEMERVWKPKYAAEAEGAGTDTEFEGYSVETVTSTLFNLSYKVNDRITIQNELEHLVGGVYESGLHDASGTGDKRWNNEFGVVATLF